MFDKLRVPAIAALLTVTAALTFISAQERSPADAAPANDNCSNAQFIGSVSNLSFSTIGASYDGGGSCMSSPNIWYCYNSTSDGDVVVSLCGSSYDTKLAVYDDYSCSPLPSLVACNDDACGSQSEIVFSAQAGYLYLIEVGGDGASSGNGYLTVESVFGPPEISNCPTSTIYVDHCEASYYDFELEEPEPEAVSWSVTAGPGSINSEGVYNSGLVEPGLYSVTVQVMDMYMNYDECEFDLQSTNYAPYWTSDCNDTVTAAVGDSLLYQLGAFDLDQCDDLTFSIKSTTPAVVGDHIIPEMGGFDFLVFVPDPADLGGTYCFELAVTDDYEEDVCSVWVEVTEPVLEGDDCSNPIVIDELPFDYTDATSNFTDACFPPSEGCFDSDTLSGIGPDVVFKYVSPSNQVLAISVAPLNVWDVALYVLDECGEVLSCVSAENEHGAVFDEQMIIAVEPLTYYIVIDGVVGQQGPVHLDVDSSGTALCDPTFSVHSSLTPEEIEIDVDPEEPKTQKKTGKARQKVLARAVNDPDAECHFGYRLERDSNKDGVFIYAYSGDDNVKKSTKAGEAAAKVEFTGDYILQAAKLKPDKTKELLSDVDIPCTLKEFRIKYGLYAIRDDLPEEERDEEDPSPGPASFYLEYTRIIEPFYNDEWTQYFDPDSAGWLDANPGDSYRLDLTKNLKEKKANVPSGKSQKIKLWFTAHAKSGKGAYAYAYFKSMRMKITCNDPPGQSDALSETDVYDAETYPVVLLAGDRVLGDYDDDYAGRDPIVIRLSSIDVQPVQSMQGNDIALNSGFCTNFIPVLESFENGGIAFSSDPGLGTGLIFTNRVNPRTYWDTVSLYLEFPADSSALYSLSGDQVDSIAIFEPLTSPAEIAFDPSGTFGHNLCVSQMDEFDSLARPVFGSGTVKVVDEAGTVATLVDGLHSPVGLAFGDGAAFGDDLYVAEVRGGEITRVTPTGTASAFATGLKTPVDLAMGSGDYGDCLYVAEYDTAFTDPTSYPNSGRISKVSPSGTVSIFANSLQAPTSLAFGPGPEFGTDLYVSLDNEYKPEGAYFANTGRIVKIAPDGTVTDFVEGLESPDYLAFDPSGVLYVAVAGGIVRIAPAICGDADGNSLVNIADAVYLISYIFGGGPAPSPLEAGDVDCNEIANIADAVYLIAYIFGGGPVPCEACP